LGPLSKVISLYTWTDLRGQVTLQRMDEKGVTRAEGRRTIEIGQIYPAKFGRWKYGISFSYVIKVAVKYF
jgi:hypothetical protein